MCILGRSLYILRKLRAGPRDTPRMTLSHDSQIEKVVYSHVKNFPQTGAKGRKRKFGGGVSDAKISASLSDCMRLLSIEPAEVGYWWVLE